MLELLKDGYDLHVHCAPDVVKRRFTDLELAKRYVAAGMKGFAIKSHQLCTAGRAALVREYEPQCNAIGTITLNNAMGGFNPMAVEMAARMGAKIVWFPTVDAKNQFDFLNCNRDVAAPYGAVADNKTLKRHPLTVMENGHLRDDVYEVIEVIKQNNMVLATGHISVEESALLIREAARKGVQKIVLTHAEFPATLASIAFQKECVKQGAFIEHNYLQIACGETEWDIALEGIRAIGAEHILICSDGGQTSSVPPDEAIVIYCKKLLEQGMSESDIMTIFVKNTSLLVE